jgi:hypothetical protein
MAFIRETSTSGIDESLSGAFSVAGLITATSGIQLGNEKIFASDGTLCISTSTSSDVTIAGDLTVSGNDIKSSSATVLTFSSDDVTVAGDLTVTGASSGKFTLGADTDTVDRTIVFGHGTLKTVMGIDDDQDVFAINADNTGAFEAVNDIEISSGGHMAIKGDLTVTGNDIKSSSATAITLSGANATVVGDLSVTGGDVTITGGEAADVSILLQADQSDDAGDDWQLLVDYSDSNKFKIGNDLASASTYAALVAITPHATSASSLVDITGDLKVSGGRVSFGDAAEYIHNETADTITAVAPNMLLSSALTTIRNPDTDSHTTFVIDAPAANKDAKITFKEADTSKWTIGMDGSLTNNDLVFCEGSDITTDQYMVFTTINSEECVNIKKTLYVDRIKSNVSITITPDANADGGTTEAFKIAKDTGTTKFTVTEDGGCTVALGVQCTAVAHTATDDGTGTGTIAAGTSVVSVNANSDANHIIILPAPVVGNIIHLIETGTTGYELRSSTPASIGINGGTASNGESAIAGAITYVKCVCVSSTNWICSQFDADGDETKVEAAA